MTSDDKEQLRAWLSNYAELIRNEGATFNAPPIKKRFEEMATEVDEFIKAKLRLS